MLIATILIIIAITNLWLLVFEDVSTSAIKVMFFTKFLMWAIIALMATMAFHQWTLKKEVEREYEMLLRQHAMEKLRQMATGFMQRLQMDDFTDNIMDDLRQHMESMEKKESKESKKKNKD